MSSDHTVRTEIQSSGSFFFNIDSFIYYFWLHWVFVAAHRLSLGAARGATLVAVLRLLVAAAFLVVKQGLWAHRLQ